MDNKTLIDVRSPKEFLKGHIPGALNLPLFSDAERHEVGIVYKQEGEQEAISLGLTFVGPKTARWIDEARALSGPLLLYCFRGGMRSRSMAKLFQTANIPCTYLEGGYKGWRQKIGRLFEHPWDLTILGGLTGSGKTERLLKLKNDGAQVINLEELANHKGSAFGARGEQPSSEHFQNLLGEVLLKVDPSLPLFVEDESQAIGACQIPAPFFCRMKGANFEWIEEPLEARICRLLKDYEGMPKEELLRGVEKIRKGLGGAKATAAKEAILEGDIAGAIALVLDYYDKRYLYNLNKREVAQQLHLF